MKTSRRIVIGDPPKRAPNGLPLGEVAKHDEEVDRRDRESCCGDRQPNSEPPLSPCVPQTEASDDEADLLLTQRCGACGRCERQETVLVEVPNREQQERDRERDRMEVATAFQVRVGQRRYAPATRAASLSCGRCFRCEPEERDRTESHCDRLDGQ